MDVPKNFMERVGEFFANIFGEIPQPNPVIATEQVLRDISISQIVDQAQAQLDALYPNDWLWISTVVVSEGELYAVYGSDGKVYRIPLTVEGANVLVGSPEQVEINYSPVEREIPPIRVYRNADNERMYMRVISVAVLLRGTKFEIDSTDLHQSFIRHIEATGNYPIASLWHCGATLRVGQAVDVFTDGVCLWEVGKFDDTILGRGLYDDINENPDYWGTSIEYAPLALPDVEQIAGVPMYVHREGILTSSDFLPEKIAASLFTGGIITRTNRMAFQQDLKDKLAKFGLSDSQIADAESTSRTINDKVEAENLVTRAAAEEEKEPEAEVAPEPKPEEEPTPEPQIIEIDTEQIAGQVAEILADKSVTPDQLAAVSEQVSELRSLITTLTGQVEEAVTLARKTDAQRSKEARASAPTQVIVRGSYTKKDAPEPEEDDDDDGEDETTNSRQGNYKSSSVVAKLRAKSGAKK